MKRENGKRGKSRIVRALVFDLDDTLYPEYACVMSGFGAVAAWAEDALGIPADQGLAELRRLFEDGIRGKTFDHWLEDHGINPDSLVLQMVRVYREHDPQIEPYPEVPALLQRLSQQYCLGLITDGPLEVQKRKLVALGLASYFDAVVFSDRWGRESWKPSPKPFEAVLGRLGVEGPLAVYVADNPTKDFLGARRVGMWTVRVRRPDGLYCHLKPPSSEHAPHVEIETLDKLEAACAQWIDSQHVRE